MDRTLRFSLAGLLLGVALEAGEVGCFGGGGGGGHGGSPPVSVSVMTAGNQTSVEAATTVVISASVFASNMAVTWSLSGASCPSQCGSLNSNTANPVTYTAPSGVTTSLLVTVTATSVQDPTKFASVTLTVVPAECQGGQEPLLKGQYAFLLRGGEGGEPVVIAGSFAADGMGHISGGSIDQNRVLSGPATGLAIQGTGSSYSVGADQRGCLTLATSAGVTTFHFAVGSLSSGTATRGQLIEFDDATGNGTRAEGLLRLQDASAFGPGLDGQYVLGLIGGDSRGRRVASIGVITSNGAGSFASGAVDTNASGTITSPSPATATGTYGVRDSNGRGTLTLSVNGAPPANFVFYEVSTKEVILLSVDPQGPGTPMLSGQLLRQTATSFDKSALNANAVVWLSGIAPTSPAATVSIGVLNADGNGGYSLIFDTNQAGTFTPLVHESGTYAVGANGRSTTTTTMGHPPLILYLLGPDEAVVLGTDAEASFGRLVAQNLGNSFGNSSFSGTYFYGTDGPKVAARLIASGSVSFDGIGTYSGIEDESTPGGLFPSVPFTGVYSFSSASSPPGRGALDSNSPPNQLAYAISPSLLVYFNTPAARPRLLIVEK